MYRYDPHKQANESDQADRQVDCFDIVGENQAVTEGTLLAQFEKAKSAAPSILLLHHIEALAKKAESTATGKIPPIVKFIDDLLGDMRVSSMESGWPIILMGTIVDEESAPGDLLSCFKQDIQLSVSLTLRCKGRKADGDRRPMKPQDLSSYNRSSETSILRPMSA